MRAGTPWALPSDSNTKGNYVYSYHADLPAYLQTPPVAEKPQLVREVGTDAEVGEDAPASPVQVQAVVAASQSQSQVIPSPARSGDAVVYERPHKHQPEPLGEEKFADTASGNPLWQLGSALANNFNSATL